MTVNIQWPAGNGAAWTHVQDGKVELYCGSTTHTFTLTSDQADKLGDELKEAAKKITGK